MPRRPEWPNGNFHTTPTCSPESLVGLLVEEVGHRPACTAGLHHSLGVISRRPLNPRQGQDHIVSPGQSEFFGIDALYASEQVLGNECGSL